MCLTEQQESKIVEEVEEEEEHEYEYTNYGTQKEPRFGKVSYQVAGGGMMNGNAYATIEIKEGIYYYCEYGKNASRQAVGDKIVWSDEIYDKKNEWESRAFDIIDTKEEEEEELEEDFWTADCGCIEFFTAKKSDMEEYDAEEWGTLLDFTDKRKKERGERGACKQRKVEKEDEFPVYSYQEQLAKCKDPTDDFGNCLLYTSPSPRD